MKKFRQKNFGGITSRLNKAKKTVKDFYHKNPASIVTTGTFVASTSNLAMNASRKNQDKAYQDEQLKAMRDLTGALNKVDNNLKTVAVKQPSTKKKETNSSFRFRKFFSKKNNYNNMINFRKKEFSILGDTLQGASIGGSLGIIASGLGGKDAKGIKLPKFRSISENKINSFNNSSAFIKRSGIIGAGIIIGASLGALVGLIKKGDELISQKSTVDNRLMDKVITDLKKAGFKEGINFTRDPHEADRLKTPISIAITRNSGELKLLVNTITDDKLKSITKELIKNLPNSSVVSQEAKNRYNEISITSISDGSADVGLIAGIAERFIRNKYPIYLVEVG